MELLSKLISMPGWFLVEFPPSPFKFWKIKTIKVGKVLMEEEEVNFLYIYIISIDHENINRGYVWMIKTKGQQIYCIH